MTTQIRKYTPSLLDGATLERLYVERDKVLVRIVERLNDTRNGGGVGHTLIDGPRGAGKTHLVSLINHRLRQSHPTAPVAWLVEDPYDILSYQDLLSAIVERCELIAPATGSSIEHLEFAIREAAQTHGPIVVLAENFDEILDQIGNLGQQQFRRLIESERCLQLVVTTTAISKPLADQPEPFYGFFNHVRLEPFTTDQAVEYLKRRAEVIGDDTFVEQLDDPERQQMARRRVQSIEQLAGGQPRIWALLAQGLGIDQLDELVHYLVENFDDITPYYQSQLRQLAPLQRRIVLTLVRQDRAMSAKAMTKHIDATSTTITKTLRDLTSKGWVRPVDSPLAELVDQRFTYYELSEPLLRLALELKHNASQEISTILNFVKLWFDPDEIERESENQYIFRAAIELTGDDATTTTRWMLSLPTANPPSLQRLGTIFDALLALANGDAKPLLDLPSVIRRAIETRLDGESDLRVDIADQALASAGFEPTPESAQWLDRVRRLYEETDSGDDVLALVAEFSARNWDFSAAQTAIAQLNPAMRIRVLENLASCYRSGSRYEDAVQAAELAWTHSVDAFGETDERTLLIGVDLAWLSSMAGRGDEALEIADLVLSQVGEAYGETHRATQLVRTGVAHLYAVLHRASEATELAEMVLAQHAHTFGETAPLTLLSRKILTTVYGLVGRVGEATELAELVATQYSDTLGETHPDTLASLNNLASMLVASDRFEEATELAELVATQYSDTLGETHPKSIAALNRLKRRWLV